MCCRVLSGGSNGMRARLRFCFFKIESGQGLRISGNDIMAGSVLFFGEVMCPPEDDQVWKVIGWRRNDFTPPLFTDTS